MRNYNVILFTLCILFLSTTSKNIEEKLLSQNDENITKNTNLRHLTMGVAGIVVVVVILAIIAIAALVVTCFLRGVPVGEGFMAFGTTATVRGNTVLTTPGPKGPMLGVPGCEYPEFAGYTSKTPITVANPVVPATTAPVVPVASPAVVV